jgi:hypothetical protein
MFYILDFTFHIPYLLYYFLLQIVYTKVPCPWPRYHLDMKPLQLHQV